MFDGKSLRGIVSYVPTVFTDSGLVDEERNRENYRRLIDAGMHGLQTLGSAAEFFSLTLAEHETLVGILTEEVQRTDRHVVTMVGCGAHGLIEAIARAKVARRYGIDAAMLISPYYFPLDAAGVAIYLEKVAAAVPGLALVHYNSPSTKIVLTSRDYAQMKHIKSLVATKQALLTPVAWRDMQEQAGHLNHMDCDDHCMFSFMNGATAVDLMISAMRPRLALQLYEACAEGNWEAALPLQQYVWDIMRDVNYGFVEGHGYSDCTGDKALVEASGFLQGGDPRAPYVPMTAEHKAELAQRMAKYPDVE